MRAIVPDIGYVIALLTSLLGARVLASICFKIYLQEQGLYCFIRIVVEHVMIKWKFTKL